MNTEQILKKLTLKEKIRLCDGADFWHTKDLSKYGLPSMMMCDGPHGLRCQKNVSDMLGINESEKSTCFPTAVTTACSWDPELLGKVGMAIAEEAKSLEVGVVLGPGANIKRDPLCGRNFEYFSEDPFLAGKLAASFIDGAQETGIGTSLKHFALNNQEYKRFNGDSQADERTMREIYLAAFEKAVKKSQPRTVMCSYNKINGVQSSDNKWLLTDVLRNEWGFKGLVVTDWGAMHDRREGFRAGCDLNMPGGSGYMEPAVLKAVKKGELSEADIDRSALRVLDLMANAAEVLKDSKPFDVDAHHALAKKAACAGAVLLKNDGGLLPLSKDCKIAIIGDMAQNPRYQGSGSSHINPTRIVSARGSMPQAVFAQGCREDGTTSEALIAEAVNAAKGTEAAVVFAGLPNAYECEGFDRANMKMPDGHIELINAVAVANKNTVVVLCCGSAVECPWADNVNSILYMGLPGQAGGEAAADLIYGDATPCGRLAETWPLTYEDCPTSGYWYEEKNPQYREGIYVGYRYYDKAQKPVRWPFGFGLSYTDFEYTDLKADNDGAEVTVTNTGNRAGAHIVQLYIAPPQDGIHRPLRELKGFAKVYLEKGESKTVSIPLDERSFAVWSDGWKTPGGDYTVCVGALGCVLHIEGEAVDVPDWQKGSWYEKPEGTPSQEEWEKLYGKADEHKEPARGEFTMNSTVIEMKDHSFVINCLYKMLKRKMAKQFGVKENEDNPEFRMFMSSSTDAPLRSMQISSGMKDKVFKGLLHMANGRFFKGLFTMLGRNK